MLLLADPDVEQSLLVNVEGVGVVVIAGCGHPGIQKMMQRADALFDEPIVGFVGGLHYPTSDGRDIQPNLDFLKTYHPVIVAPSAHDSSQPALDAIRAAFPEAYRDMVVEQEIVVGAEK
ncbi:MAG TPA: hypothetical protein VHO69_09410 [Phototrophicaceae bacterium]|nr:hypothetical protein [Phototrophicaceae bacterium]